MAVALSCAVPPEFVLTYRAVRKVIKQAKSGRDVMRTFYVHADINKLLEQVGVSDDWIGAIIDAFVIDYVFERPSVIAETMDELAPPTCKVCGDPYSAHQHYRSGID
jgi:hypothetical protein